MKQLNQYIQEKLHVSNYKKDNIINYQTFVENIKKLFNLKDDETEHMILCFDTDIDVKKLKTYKFKLIDNNFEDSDDLFSLGADMVNHPSKYKTIKIYVNSLIDLYVYLYNYSDNQYLYFIDHLNDKYYIYLLIK